MEKIIVLSNGRKIKIEFSQEITGVLKAINRSKKFTGNNTIFLTNLDIEPSITDTAFRQILQQLVRSEIGIYIAEVGIGITDSYSLGDNVKNFVMKIIIKEDKVFNEFADKYFELDQQDKSYLITLYSKSRMLVYNSPVDNIEHNIKEFPQMGYKLIEYLILNPNVALTGRIVSEGKVFPPVRKNNKDSTNDIEDVNKRIQSTIDSIRKRLQLTKTDTIFDGKVSIGIKLRYKGHIVQE